MLNLKFNKDERIKNTWKTVRALNGIEMAVVTDSSGCVYGIETHCIADDGTVSPSLVCPHKCGFHEFVKLCGWEKIHEPKQH